MISVQAWSIPPGKEVEAIQSLRQILACLHAQYFLYQTAHWQSSGQNFYGNHLLFQRLYEQVSKEVDAFSEKLVGYFGMEAVNPIEIHMLSSMVVGSLSKVKGLVDRGLQSEQYLIDLVSKIYKAFKVGEYFELPLGLDDFLMGLCNDHESHVYLLQQTSKVAKQAPSAEKFFFDAPRKREVREFANSRALTNDPKVTSNAVKDYPTQDCDINRRSPKPPPTPNQILKRQPGTDDFSTLARYMVDTEQSTNGGNKLPHGWNEIKKQPKIKG